MIGIIQKVLFDLVRAEGGEAAELSVRDRAAVPPDQTYRIDTDYSDGECGRLFAAAAGHFGWTDEDMYDRYADAFLAYGQRRFPEFFAMAPNARAFLARQPRIHACFGAGLRDAAQRRAVDSKFSVAASGESLEVTYDSPNRLCGLYRSLSEALLRLYGEDATVEEIACARDGAPACRFRFDWAGRGAPR